MRFTRISVLILLLSLLSLTIIGQTNKGGISGTVTDSKGSPIAGASVTITNKGTNQATTLVTSEEGAYTLNTLDPVVYNVSVEAANFKKTLVENIKVDTST